MLPTSMLPVLMPIRIRSGVPPQCSAAARCKASRRWHSSAAEQASLACRTLGTGAPQNAITPSPMNLSIVPLRLRTAVETASRYSASSGPKRSRRRAERLGDAGIAGKVGDHHGQCLLVSSGASLDPARDQCANELRRHVLLERREPPAHL